MIAHVPISSLIILDILMGIAVIGWIGYMFRRRE